MANKKLKVEKAKMSTPENGQKHVLKGRVVAATLAQTVTVLVERRKTHPLYGKSFVSSKRYLAHTEQKLVLGDVVEIAQIRPMSKNKYFAVVKVTGRDIEAVVAEQLKEEAAAEIAEVMPEEKVEAEEQVEVEKKEEVLTEEEPKHKRKDK